MRKGEGSKKLSTSWPKFPASVFALPLLKQRDRLLHFKQHESKMFHDIHYPPGQEKKGTKVVKEMLHM